MKKASIWAGIMLAIVMVTVPVFAGFENGYNRVAGIFVGTGEVWAMEKLGYGHEQAEAYMGIYAHDQIVMKWNPEWDRGNDEGWTDTFYGAWENNEWNGMRGKCIVDGNVEGSGEIWIYRIIWVGYEGSPYWREGGYIIWGQFEVILSQGVVEGMHIWDVLAIPCGY